MQELSWLAEYAAFTIMLGLSLIIGFYYGCVQEGKQNTVNEYLLGGKHMSVFPITMSLIASHVSGIMLLGIPTEIYIYGTQYLSAGVVNILVVIIIIYIFMPVFYELQLTSVYEYLELRFDSKIRAFTSLLFALYLILYIPVVIYVPALAFNQVIGLNVHTVSQIICAICIFYTTIGGLKAVVWTDAIQSVFTSLSIAIVIILGFIQVGGFDNMIKANLEGGRIEFFNMNLDPFMRDTFWTVGANTIFSGINSLGIHPGAVQRFIALPTLKKARKAMIYFGLGMAVVKILTGLVGMLIYAKYKDCDPTLANYIGSSKNLVPYYVMDIAGKFPGITGLFISGTISAALSTMSAQLNTVSGTIYEDFIVKILGIKVSDFTASIIMKCIVVVTGIICVALVYVVEKMKGIIQMVVSLGGITCGATVAIFTLGICFPWVNSRGAMCGMLASLGIMTWIISGTQLAIQHKELMFVEKNLSIAECPKNITFKNYTDFSGLYQMNDDVYVNPNLPKIYTLSFMHYSTVGTLIGIAVGILVSLLFPVEQNIDPKLLTPCVRKFMYPKYMDNSKLETKAEEYKIVSQETTL